MNTPKTIRFSTKANTNGNILKMEVDIANNTISKDYYLFIASSDDIKLTPKEMNKLFDNYIKLGYKRV